MVCVLIPTHVKDTHALAVTLALAAKGHIGVRWFGADCPSRQTQTIAINDDLELRVEQGDCDGFSSTDVDVLWYRRPQRPSLLADMCQADTIAATSAWRDFDESKWFALENKALAVNPVSSYIRSNSKALQLRVAKASGLRIPESIMSNDPRRIREFVRSQNGEVIYKSFYPTYWKSGSHIYSSKTVTIRLEDLTSEWSLRAAPGIFQEKISKSCDVRVTFFGSTCLAARIDSQSHSRGRTDWRCVPVGMLNLTPMTLPDGIYSMCRRIMKELGIVFGCFDFAISDRGEWVFFEVNEMGQFLWVEHMNPAFEMLNTFTNFLISMNPEYSGESHGKPVSGAEIFGSVEFKSRLESDEVDHVQREAVQMIDDVE